MAQIQGLLLLGWAMLGCCLAASASVPPARQRLQRRAVLQLLRWCSTAPLPATVLRGMAAAAVPLVQLVWCSRLVCVQQQQQQRHGPRRRA
jgi:hypothetical protein